MQRPHGLWELGPRDTALARKAAADLANAVAPPAEQEALPVIKRQPKTKHRTTSRLRPTAPAHTTGARARRRGHDAALPGRAMGRRPAIATLCWQTYG
ncbi:hypothetical protein [Streptomyces sp. NPDC093225]|uniref:hypothetical protein n=1 Tax=Streptomyces sp. NPDC093225 TaxID=3366034 RepID=UPI003808A458